MVVVGLPGAIVTAGMMTLFQQHTNDRERGRVFALLLLVRSVTTALGGLTAGLLGGRIGIVPVMACGRAPATSWRDRSCWSCWCGRRIRRPPAT